MIKGFKLLETLVNLVKIETPQGCTNVFSLQEDQETKKNSFKFSFSQWSSPTPRTGFPQSLVSADLHSSHSGFKQVDEALYAAIKGSRNPEQTEQTAA